MQADIWDAREGVARLADNMAGYKVVTRDGRLGKVDRVSYAGNCLYLSAGGIRKRRYVIPAGAVERIDTDNRSIVVAATADEIEKAPRYDQRRGLDEQSELETAAYYRAVTARHAAR